ncbi:MAG: hypothetical protein U5L08_07865 [Xanthomonadales bacterium]|nr:hypothetical protein [Xanthomonadales bacterium]
MFDHFEHVIGDFPTLLPVFLKPLLELVDLARALDLDIEFDVLRQPRLREVTGADQRL